MMSSVVKADDAERALAGQNSSADETSPAKTTCWQSFRDGSMKCFVGTARFVFACCTCLITVVVVLILVFVVFVPDGAECAKVAVKNWGQIEKISHDQACCDATLGNLDGFAIGHMIGLANNPLFDGMNFVDGDFEKDPVPKWGVPVKGEKIDVVTFAEATNVKLPGLTDSYFTLKNVPSWERNEAHERAVSGIIKGFLHGSTCLFESFANLLTPRVAKDQTALMTRGWNGFFKFGYHDIRYASNGDFGYDIAMARMNEFQTQDVLGLLASETVFSCHLKRVPNDGSDIEKDITEDIFEMDFSDMAQYTPIDGFASLGGRVRFQYSGTGADAKQYGRLRTLSIDYGGKTYAPDATFMSTPATKETVARKWEGYRFAEKAVISSLLSQTNLITHVKTLHLELAPALQGVTVNVFYNEPTHPLRRLLDPFIHRTVQATNANLDLLFHVRTAEFSLAPLPLKEQERLLLDYVVNRSTSFHDLHMQKYAQDRGMATYSQLPTDGDPHSKYFWRWHYRTSTVQSLYESFIKCSVEKNYGFPAVSPAWSSDADTSEDAKNPLLINAVALKWWSSLFEHLPSLKLTMQKDAAWLSNGRLTSSALLKVLSTLMVWVSWMHEDVGHAASYFVYNPALTPMQTPVDGGDIPFNSFAFNTMAYRNAVFLERARLLDPPPSFWFDATKGDKQCYLDFQTALKGLGDTDAAFSQCGKTGFYSCVKDVETAVSS